MPGLATRHRRTQTTHSLPRLHKELGTARLRLSPNQRWLAQDVTSKRVFAGFTAELQSC